MNAHSSFLKIYLSPIHTRFLLHGNSLWKRLLQSDTNHYSVQKFLHWSQILLSLR